MKKILVLITLISVLLNAESGLNKGLKNTNTIHSKVSFLGIEMLSKIDKTIWDNDNDGDGTWYHSKNIKYKNIAIRVDKADRIVFITLDGEFDENGNTRSREEKGVWVRQVYNKIMNKYGTLKTSKTSWGGYLYNKRVGDFFVQIVNDSYPNVSFEYKPLIVNTPNNF